MPKSSKPTLHEIFKRAAESSALDNCTIDAAICWVSEDTAKRLQALNIVHKRTNGQPLHWLAKQLGMYPSTLLTKHYEEFVQWKRDWLNKLAEEFKDA